MSLRNKRRATAELAGGEFVKLMGCLIEEARLVAGLSRKRMASEVGITEDSYAILLSGSTSIRASTIECAFFYLVQHSESLREAIAAIEGTAFWRQKTKK